MIKYSHSKSIKLLSSCALLTLSSTAFATEKSNQDGLLEEVIVTAQKRESSLQDTPVSISALSGDVMAAIGIRNIEDFTFFVPGITVTNDSMAIVNIRGVGTSAFGVATDPSSTVQIDGVYQPRPTTGYQDMFDIERVELLRGPQGVLFGRNSTGGTLNIISKAPTDEWEGALGVTLGNFNKRTFSGTLSGPLSDKVRARATVLKNDRDGIYTDILSDDTYQDQDNFGARATIAIDVSDEFEVVLRGDFTNERETGFPAVRTFYPQSFADAGATIPTGDREVAFDTTPVSNLEVWGVSSTATWSGEDITFKSITSYRESDIAQVIDADATDLSLFDINFREQSRSFTQEIQFSNNEPEKLEWIVGAFFLNEDGTGGIDLIFQDPTIEIPERNVTNAYALFGQGTYSITDRFRATFGLRYSYEKKSYDFATIVNGTEVDGGSPEDSWKAWTPRFALDYDISDDVLLYASATRGFKSGGFQLGDAGSFDPEYLWSYEAGLKSTLFDRRLRANIGAFRYDYTNLQVVEYVGGVATTSNAGKATINGLEGEFVARVSDGFDLNATVAYLDATYTNFFEDGVDFSGNRLANSPKWAYSFGAQYRYSVPDFGELTFRTDYAWRDNVDFKRNNQPQFRADTYALLNARISYLSEDGNWEVSLYGQNLTNNRYVTYITSGRNVLGEADASLPVSVFGEPRQYGIQLKRTF
ncbi:TonB-dependent receptor [Kordiimonas sp. SCSIO 12603]|uniref:TonB-dependent receptor n=1 Tax=Kordiimonas sp. SCSIO 12603 TaxID=2829596 RepID=UPI002101E33D|nr:TonB-dependent receptor [Kordiimonas sp. SCSIO 12603]UTW59462.1 TonB-dependent receptor [Kordiimonas sp. SCSIO 12603]